MASEGAERDNACDDAATSIHLVRDQSLLVIPLQAATRVAQRIKRICICSVFACVVILKGSHRFSTGGQWGQAARVLLGVVSRFLADRKGHKRGKSKLGRRQFVSLQISWLRFGKVRVGKVMSSWPLRRQMNVKAAFNRNLVRVTRTRCCRIDWLNRFGANFRRGQLPLVWTSQVVHARLIFRFGATV